MALLTAFLIFACERTIFASSTLNVSVGNGALICTSMHSVKALIVPPPLLFINGGGGGLGAGFGCVCCGFAKGGCSVGSCRPRLRVPRKTLLLGAGRCADRFGRLIVTVMHAHASTNSSPRHASRITVYTHVQIENFIKIFPRQTETGTSWRLPTPCRKRLFVSNQIGRHTYCESRWYNYRFYIASLFTTF